MSAMRQPTGAAIPASSDGDISIQSNQSPARRPQVVQAVGAYETVIAFDDDRTGRTSRQVKERLPERVAWFRPGRSGLHEAILARSRPEDYIVVTPGRRGDRQVTCE